RVAVSLPGQPPLRVQRQPSLDPAKADEGTEHHFVERAADGTEEERSLARGRGLVAEQLVSDLTAPGADGRSADVRRRRFVHFRRSLPAARRRNRQFNTHRTAPLLRRTSGTLVYDNRC